MTIRRLTRRAMSPARIGPGTKFPTLGQIPFATLRDSYEEEAHGLLEGGVDLLLVETSYDLLSAKAAIIGARRAMRRQGREVPLQVQVTIELTGRMLPGTEISAALCALEAMRPDVIGLNCATGPVEMYEPLRHHTAHSRVPVSAQPNAGLPSVVAGKMHYDLTPDELAEHLFTFARELGVSVIGGCCGTTPAHLKAVVERCGDPCRCGAHRARGGRGVALQLRPLRTGALLPQHRRTHQRQWLQAFSRGDARR